MRAFTNQFEAYRCLRHGGDRYVRVEHVHINEGAQAVIGNVHPHCSVVRPSGPSTISVAPASYGSSTVAGFLSCIATGQ